MNVGEPAQFLPKLDCSNNHHVIKKAYSRELENLIERSVILSHGHALHVPLGELRTDLATPSEPDNTLDAAEREHIIRVLRETGGRISGPDGAARRLGLKRTTLQSKMQRLKITRDDYSGPSGS